MRPEKEAEISGRTMRSCQVCGKSYYGSKDRYYCPDCAKTKKSDTVVQTRICQDCGAEFQGGPRARRCADCAYKAALERGREHRKNGTKRPLGSTDKCVLCGQEYTVVSPRQKYCSDTCQREGVLAWQREHKKGYSRASKQDEKKMQRRAQVEKICVYCLRTFTSDRPTNTCSEYCRTEQVKLDQCRADLKRGRKRDLDKYEDKRAQYRERIKNAEQD